ncbi:MAG: apolipoprotein N-acyltransferase, partial [Acidimicrobiales bacterium]
PYLVRLATGVVAGALIALSVPPFAWWPLAIAGYGLVALLLRGTRIRQRIALGLATGIAQYVIGVWWVNEFSIFGAVALMLLGAVWVAAALAIAGGRRWWRIAVGLPGAMVLSDWARANFPLGGFPLAGTSLGQANSPLAVSVRLGGALLLTGVTALSGVALAMLCSGAVDGSRRRGRTSTRRPLSAVAGGVAAAAAVAAILGVAAWSPKGSTSARVLRVALVQGGGPRGTRQVTTDPAVVFARHLAAADQIVGPVGLVAFPEGVLQSTTDFTRTPGASDLAGVAIRLGATVVAGVEQDVGTRHYLNEVVVWAPDGRIVGEYEKNHLVPFGEYVPARSWLGHFFNLSDVPLDAIAGHAPGFVATPSGPLGVMISYEVFFDQRARQAVRAGGELLVVPTNTASYRSSQVPAQELAAARLRAIETGRDLVQVTPTGYSAVVSASGNVVERSTLGRRQLVAAMVALRVGQTTYVRYGDLPPLVIGSMALVLGWARPFSRRP